jgi:hypothetical protein
MLGKGYLCAVVTQDAANWPTPAASNNEQPDYRQHAYVDAGFKSKNEYSINLPTAVKGVLKYGQAAPANPSTDGSRQGSLDQSQRNWQTFAHGTHNRGETPHRQVVKALVNGDKVKTQCLTVDQVFAEEIKGTNRQESWATPQAHDAQGPKTPEQIAAMRAKGHGVKNLNEQACWGTPTARDHKSGRGNEEREYKELTPMVERTQTGKLNPRWVETLMGLPVGWVMPSCKSPVTIEPTNSDSSAMELCQQQQNELFEC